MIVYIVVGVLMAGIILAACAVSAALSEEERREQQWLEDSASMPAQNYHWREEWRK